MDSLRCLGGHRGTPSTAHKREAGDSAQMKYPNSQAVRSLQGAPLGLASPKTLFGPVGNKPCLPGAGSAAWDTRAPRDSTVCWPKGTREEFLIRTMLHQLQTPWDVLCLTEMPPWHALTSEGGSSHWGSSLTLRL